MDAGKRLKGWLSESGAEFGERLGTWVVKSIATGVTKSLEDMEPGAIEGYKDVLTKMRDDPLTSPEMKTFYNKALKTGNWYMSLLGGMTMVLGALGALLGGSRPLGNLISYNQDRELSSARIDPGPAITAWRRDPDKYKEWFKDLAELGWTDERIEVLKVATQAYPALQDVVRFYAKEAFEPDMITRYGLRDETPPYPGTLFEKLGVPQDIANLYWIAHWEHASWNQVVQMLRRGQLTEDEVRQWYRVVEIPPYWRDKLTAISWEVPTRVDVRRWWDMRTIDESRLREVYTAQGYHDKDLDDYVLWTKVYVAFPDLIARWRNGWIDLEQVKSELTGYGMPADRVDELIETKIKAAEPERTTGERDRTKADIVKGVKVGVITRAQGVELLQEMGYDEDEAVYILEINIPPDDEEVAVRQRELTKADILKGLKTEIITRDDARTKLLDLRYSPLDAEFLLKIFDAQVKPPAEPREREASKADIIMAVKKGLITPEDAYLMLQDIDFTPEAAAFILEVKAEVSPFSPISYGEFKNLTHKYRLAAGMETKEMPEEIKRAADLVVRLTGEVESLSRSIDEEQRGLVKQEVIPEKTAARLKDLQVKRNRARAKLAKAQNDYNNQIAEWRHRLP